jgi:uncharacterized protein DUF397
MVFRWTRLDENGGEAGHEDPLARAGDNRRVWFKAAASSSNGTGCVEVTFGAPGVVGLRDSKHPEGGAFAFSSDEWRAFLSRVTH